MKRGFSTLEMMLAFAIMSVVLGGVVLANFSAQYWMINSQTSNEGLYKAKTTIEDLRATARQNFYDATSSPITKILDTSCSGGGLCYFVESVVTDLSPCSKYAQALVSWQVQRYPTTTTSLSTNLTYPAEAINQGGDCQLNEPSGAWSSPSSQYTTDFTGTPTALDTLDGISYIAINTTPYLYIINSAGVRNTTCVNCTKRYNALDVAHDSSTGRTYVYAARHATTSQLEVIDVTDSSNPSMLAQATFAGVDPYGSFPEGWRVFYYDRKVYVTMRDSAGPELHVFDVGNPDVPTELGGGLELTTSVYGMIVRDQYAGTVKKRFAYLATTRDPYELMVLDVTNPASMSEIVGARVDFPGSLATRAAFLNGNALYIGRDAGAGPDLYVLDASAPLSASGGLPILKSVDIGSGVSTIRVSGQFIFLATTGGQLQIRNTSDLSLVSSFGIAGLVDTALDLNGDYIYAASASSPRLRALKGN